MGHDMHVSDLHFFFFCLHDMSLSCVLLAIIDPAIIVLNVTCACGTPWTFLLTFFNKWKMEIFQFLCV